MQNLFKMLWLNNLAGKFLQLLGIDTGEKVGASLQFFIYDSIKISLLLVILIFCISFIQSFFPPERTKKILSRFDGIFGNIIGALLGTVTPFCSCSSIPIFMGFTAAGVPIGISFSFLISSPMVDLGSLVLLMSIFGAKIALIYVVAGLIIAILGGVLIEKLNMERYVEPFVLNLRGKNADDSLEEMKIKDRLHFAVDQVVFTFKKVFPYILIGVGIGAIIHNWVPEEFIKNLLGNNNPFGVILATIVGIPMYGDIFGAIPVAEALLAKGAQLGVALSFMMAVTTLSLPSMIMLKRVLKGRLLLLFISICIAGIILVGYLFNILEIILL
ncbi:MAG: permease [Eubacteriales bacterium]|nr:permease [Eubacteriales bacterium]